MSYVLALDQGTTSSRAILSDRTGRIVARAQRELRQHYPRQGWVEHDPLEIWTSQLACAQAVLSDAGISAGEIAAVGIANQRETTLVWERRGGRPLGNAIVWQDRRTAPICDRLKREGMEALFTGKTGLVIDPYFSATKLRWMLDHVPNARARAARGELAFGTVDSWLMWHLTGGALHVIDVTNASRTMLFNIHTRDWDDKLLQVLNIPRELLPGVVPSCGVVAETDPALFGVAIPIAGIAGDQQAALFGQRCVRPGMVKNTYGTGCFMLMHTGDKPIASPSKLVATVAWGMRDATEYALEGSVFIAGAVVQWLRDGLGLIESSADIEPLAASVPDTGGVYFVPALAGLGAPHWDPYARGTIQGITRATTRAHLARAALEAVAFQSNDLIGAMQRDSGIALAELRVDGGAAVNDLLMQFQADLLGVRVVRPRITETTGLGAAYLAGLGAGIWSASELDAQWEVERSFEPSMAPARVAELKAGWQRALERSRDWARTSVE